MIDHRQIYRRGIMLQSSGTTGPSKRIFQSPEKLSAARAVCLRVQGIDQHSKILTVCKTSHAAGLLAQTLPALSVGAEVTIRPFNAYEFVRLINNHTHTHITPLHAAMIMQTKTFAQLDLQGITVVCGAEPVSWHVIRAFVSTGCRFIVNWGMTEIGPIAINQEFNSLDQVDDMMSWAGADSVILGSQRQCHVRVHDQQLHVQGEISVYGSAWFATGDLVEIRQGCIFYLGRQSQPVSPQLTKF